MTSKIINKKEESSPVEKMYKVFFNKKKRSSIVSNEAEMNNLKKISPAFGRTAYILVNNKDNDENEIFLYNNK